jgi:hypothetical protein
MVAVSDAKPYQQFFNALEKAMFLTATTSTDPRIDTGLFTVDRRPEIASPSEAKLCHGRVFAGHNTTGAIYDFRYRRFGAFAVTIVAFPAG